MRVKATLSRARPTTTVTAIRAAVGHPAGSIQPGSGMVQARGPVTLGALGPTWSDMTVVLDRSGPV
jgi:hypothetical protein